jgi:phospholipase/carboxylesterase
MSSALETVEVQTGSNPTAAVIWMHGLGADGHDFEPVVPHVAAALKAPLRFIFPHAPVRQLTINAGMTMRAWYDIMGPNWESAQDDAGIRASEQAIGALIRGENDRGIPSERIALAGFSQGGAMSLHTGARYPQRLAGIIALSCYLPLATSFNAERRPENQNTPVFLAHGSLDPMVEERRGIEARTLLEAAGYAVEWHSYRIAHSVCDQEIADIAAFLRRVVPA